MWRAAALVWKVTSKRLKSRGKIAHVGTPASFIPMAPNLQGMAVSLQRTWNAALLTRHQDPSGLTERGQRLSWRPEPQDRTALLRLQLRGLLGSVLLADITLSLPLEKAPSGQGDSEGGCCSSPVVGAARQLHCWRMGTRHLRSHRCRACVPRPAVWDRACLMLRWCRGMARRPRPLGRRLDDGRR